MNYWQIIVNTEKTTVESVSQLLSDLAALSLTVESADDSMAFDVSDGSQPMWPKQKISALFNEDADIECIQQQLVSAGYQSDVEKVLSQDWQKSGQDRLKPFKVAAQMWVCPSWCEPVKPDALNLLIDPQMAFGTGTHETTKLCLKTIARHDWAGKSVLDYGCGSGILAIAALKLGARHAVGVDIEENAVATTLVNAQKNAVSEQLSAMTPTVFEQLGMPPFDAVFANILLPALLELNESLSAMVKPGGFLMLSGILTHQQATLLSYYQQWFDFTVSQDGDWLVLVGCKRSV